MRTFLCAACVGLMVVALGRAEEPSSTDSAKQPGAHPENLVIDLGDGVTIELVLIRPGTFLMGSDKGWSEKPIHKVTITKPFYMSKYEVTQEQWQVVMSNNPSYFKGPKNPVDGVSWYDCQTFMRKLGEKADRRDQFHLPTEAQWEYACRAGSATEYCYGDDPNDLGEYAWYLANSSGETHAVGQKKPNAWGLYDMHGNVSEWCADFFASDWYEIVSSGTDAVMDPTGPFGGNFCVLRGADWKDDPQDCRSAYRLFLAPSYQYGEGVVGFRVALDLPE